MIRSWKLKLAVSLGVLGLVLSSPFIWIWYYSRFVDPSGASTNDIRWHETVRLASGESIQVKRHVRFMQEYSVGGGPINAAEYQSASLEIVPPTGGFITWTAPIIPILLDRDPANGEWIVVGGDNGGLLWNINGKPCPPQWAFRLHDGVWYVQPVPGILIGRKPNLLVDLRVGDDAEFSSEAFGVIAAERMKRQITVGDHIPPSMTSVGVIATKQVPCDGRGAPRFTDKFLPDRTTAPTLASFPRLP